MFNLIDDTMKLNTQKRNFDLEARYLPILRTLGIDKYDQVPSMDKLVFKMREALQTFQRLYQTLDKGRIQDVIKLCLARELTRVEERKDAQEYALKRPKSFDMFEENNDLSAIKSTSWAQSSPSRMGSPSPKKSTRMDGMKTGGRDLNNTGFELKSIGESDGRRAPVAFKDPPALRGTLHRKTTAAPSKDAPTAENLRRLNTKMSTTARSDAGGGAKSARSLAMSIGHRSRNSGGVPANPYEEHTVEQMDVLIAQTTTEINKLNFKKRQFESNSLDTKTTIKAKVKPINEEIN